MSLDYHALLNELGLDEDSESDRNDTTFNYKTTTNSQINRARLIVNINLSQDVAKQLIVYEGQENSDAVYEFCRQNGLDQISYGELLRQIEGSHTTPDKVWQDQGRRDTSPAKTTYYSGSQAEEYRAYDGMGPHRPTRDVYERLYNRAIMKKQQQEQEQCAEKQINHQQLQDYYAQNKLPPGERLYQFGLKKQLEKEHQIQMMKEQDETSHKQEHTFKPVINENTKILVQQMGYNNQQDHFKRLTQKKKAREESPETSDPSHTFKPQISEISNQLATFMRQASQFDNVYDQLYYQGVIKRSQEKQIIDDIPLILHHPLTNMRTTSTSQYTFLERVQMDVERKKQKIDFLRMQNNNVDMTTGQLLYNPRVGRAPKGVARLKIQKDVFQNLYDQASNISQKITHLKEDEKRELENIMVRCGERSDDMAFENRKQSIKNIFSTLDQHGDGLVRCSSIETQLLPLKFQHILYPILQELQQNNPDGVEFDEFFERVYKFTLQLPQSDKNTIYLQKKRTLQNSNTECTFNPKINENSRRMCKNKQDYIMCKCQVCKENTNLLSLLQNDTLG